MKMTTGAKRRDKLLTEALKRHYGGGQRVFMDCYNQILYDEGFTPTITTRIDHCSHYFILEVYEED